MSKVLNQITFQTTMLLMQADLQAQHLFEYAGSHKSNDLVRQALALTCICGFSSTKINPYIPLSSQPYRIIHYWYISQAGWKDWASWSYMKGLLTINNLCWGGSIKSECKQEIPHARTQHVSETRSITYGIPNGVSLTELHSLELSIFPSSYCMCL